MKKAQAIALSNLFIRACVKHGARLVEDELTELSSAVVDRTSTGWKALRVTHFDIIDKVDYFGIVIDWKSKTVDVVPVALPTATTAPLDLSGHATYYDI